MRGQYLSHDQNSRFVVKAPFNLSDMLLFDEDADASV